MKSIRSLTKVCAIILAAGRGSRMKLGKINKVSLQIGGEPMVSRTIRVLKDFGIKNIIIVVGHAKETVTRLISSDILIVEQKKRLGTAHAVRVALSKIPDGITHVLVLNGDDAFFLNNTLLQKLLEKSFETRAGVTFLTLTLDDPQGLGRVIREKDQVVRIVEEKDATTAERAIHEVNAACYFFSLDFLRKYIKKIKKSKISGEYYIVDMVQLAHDVNIPIETVEQSGLQWRGVNTAEELKVAEKLLS